MSWDQRFFDPIELPGRKKLVTLRDAALYITKLPKAEHDAEEWLAAMEALLLRRGVLPLCGSHRAWRWAAFSRAPDAAR